MLKPSQVERSADRSMRLLYATHLLTNVLANGIQMGPDNEHV